MIWQLIGSCLCMIINGGTADNLVIKKGVAIHHEGAVYPPPDVFKFIIVLEWRPYQELVANFSGAITDLEQTLTRANQNGAILADLKENARQLQSYRVEIETKWRKSRNAREVDYLTGKFNKNPFDMFNKVDLHELQVVNNQWHLEAEKDITGQQLWHQQIIILNHTHTAIKLHTQLMQHLQLAIRDFVNNVNSVKDRLEQDEKDIRSDMEWHVKLLQLKNIKQKIELELSTLNEALELLEDGIVADKFVNQDVLNDIITLLTKQKTAKIIPRTAFKHSTYRSAPLNVIDISVGENCLNIITEIDVISEENKFDKFRLIPFSQRLTNTSFATIKVNYPFILLNRIKGRYSVFSEDPEIQGQICKALWRTKSTTIRSLELDIVTDQENLDQCKISVSSTDTLTLERLSDHEIFYATNTERKIINLERNNVTWIQGTGILPLRGEDLAIDDVIIQSSKRRGKPTTTVMVLPNSNETLLYDFVQTTQERLNISEEEAEKLALQNIEQRLLDNDNQFSADEEKFGRLVEIHDIKLSEWIMSNQTNINSITNLVIFFGVIAVTLYEIVKSKCKREENGNLNP